MAASALAGCGQGLPETAPPTASVLPASPSTAPASPPPSASTSSTASGGPSASGTPDGRWESDPAVQALRLQYLGAAKAVNAKSVDIPELRRSSTSKRFSRLERIWRPEYGYRYPGPIPFTPLAVTASTDTTRVVALCVLAQGWLRNPNTGLPADPRRVERGTATVVLENDDWHVDSIVGAGGSCDGVPIEEVEFS